MPITIDPLKTHEFVAHSQIDDPEPATIIFRPLTVRNRQAMSSEHGDDPVAQCWAVLELSIVDWKNFLDPDGVPLEYSFETFQGLCDDDYVSDLFIYIVNFSSVTADEAGK